MDIRLIVLSPILIGLVDKNIRTVGVSVVPILLNISIYELDMRKLVSGL